jgi:hypothetical protein
MRRPNRRTSAARPDGAGSLMAARAPDQVEGDSARVALFRQLEYFPTPPWVARAGAELNYGDSALFG